MKKKILINGLVIIILMSLTAVATWAYFGNTTDSTVQVWTAKIGITKIEGFPMLFQDLLPAETQSTIVKIKNTSTVDADFWLQMVPESPTVDTANFCIPNELIKLTIEELDGANNVVRTWHNTSICPLYTINSSPVIVQIADDVAPDQVKKYRISIYLKPEATSELMGKYNKDVIHLIATQYNGPAPVGAQNKIWPDGDDNY